MRKYTVTEYDKSDYDNFRDNLKNERVIVLLEKNDRGYLPDQNFDGTESDFDCYTLHKAIGKDIETLKREK